jgi:hypothetical protein
MPIDRDEIYGSPSFRNPQFRGTGGEGRNFESAPPNSTLPDANRRTSSRGHVVPAEACKSPSTSVNFPLVRVPLPKNIFGEIARNLVFTNKDLMAFCTSILLDVPYDIPEKWVPIRSRFAANRGRSLGHRLTGSATSMPVDRRRPHYEAFSRSHRAIVSAGRNRSHSRGSIGDLGEVWGCPQADKPKLKRRISSASQYSLPDHCRVSSWKLVKSYRTVFAKIEKYPTYPILGNPFGFEALPVVR